ncbi:MAG: EI24 domain-containing protein [Panacibacter sp.]
MLTEIIISFQSYIKAHAFIRKHRLWKWIIIPGIIYSILFFVSIYFFFETANSFNEWITLKTGLKSWLDKMDSGLVGFLFTLAALALLVVQLMLYFSLFKYVWLIVGSPVFAYLSEKTDALLNNTDYPFSFQQLLKDMWRGIKIALRNALWQTVYVVAILLLALIPVVGMGAPLIALMVECYYYGFSMLDYNCERRKMNAGESIYYIGNHKGLAIGNGLVFYFIHLVPIIGWIFAPAYAVIAATLSMHEIKTKPQP